MFRLKTIRRKFSFWAGSAAVLVGLSLYVAHTSAVRRFALSRIQLLLGSTEGIVLEATDLNYNLFQSHYELKDVVLRGKGLADLPAPVRAKRVTVTIPLWDLIHTSFNAAHIRIDGLSVRLVTAASGRSNLPSLRGSGGCAQPKGPAVTIANAEIVVQDERSRLFIQLPAARASADWNASRAHVRGFIHYLQGDYAAAAADSRRAAAAGRTGSSWRLPVAASNGET